MPDTKIESIWKQSLIWQLTEHSVTRFVDFMDIIEDTRRSCYALDKEENEIGVLWIEVSLKGYNGKSTYAISISAPKDRMSDARILLLREMILKTKHQIESNVY